MPGCASAGGQRGLDGLDAAGHPVWAIQFSSEAIDGRSVRQDGILNLSLRSGWATLMDPTEDVLAGRYLWEDEQIGPRDVVEITEFILYIGV